VRPRGNDGDIWQMLGRLIERGRAGQFFWMYDHNNRAGEDPARTKKDSTQWVYCYVRLTNISSPTYRSSDLPPAGTRQQPDAFCQEIIFLDVNDRPSLWKFFKFGKFILWRRSILFSSQPCWLSGWPIPVLRHRQNRAPIPLSNPHPPRQNLWRIIYPSPPT